MIKIGDYLYCHSDSWHNLNRFLYDSEAELVFKAGCKYKVFDRNDTIEDDPFLVMESELSGTFLISLFGTEKCQHITRFYTIEQLRAKKLEHLLD